MNANRLKIATRIAAALHSNPSCDCATFDNVTRDAFDQADSLLKYAAQSEPVEEKRRTAGEIAKEMDDFDIPEWATFHGIQGDAAKLRNAFFDARNR